MGSAWNISRICDIFWQWMPYNIINRLKFLWVWVKFCQFNNAWPKSIVYKVTYYFLTAWSHLEFEKMIHIFMMNKPVIIIFPFTNIWMCLTQPMVAFVAFKNCVSGAWNAFLQFFQCHRLSFYGHFHIRLDNACSSVANLFSFFIL